MQIEINVGGNDKLATLANLGKRLSIAIEIYNSIRSREMAHFTPATVIILQRNINT